MTSPIRDHVYRGDGGLCTYKPSGHETVCARDRDRHSRAMIDGRVQILDHIYQGVMGHPDDDECTFRADGADETYCGRSRSLHAERGDGHTPDLSPRPYAAGARLQRRLEDAAERFFDRGLSFPEEQEVHRLAAKLVGHPPLPPPLVDQYIDRNGATWYRSRPETPTTRSSPHANLVEPHEFVRRGWRWWICHHCYAPKSLHPRNEWVKARPLGDNTYYDSTAPHFKEGW